MKKTLCLFLCACMLFALSSPAMASELDEPPTDEFITPRMIERDLSDEGIHLNGYYNIRLYARPDYVYANMGYQNSATCGIRLIVKVGSPYIGITYYTYDETTSTRSTHSHTHEWRAGNYLAYDAEARYLVNGSNIQSLAAHNLQ